MSEQSTTHKEKSPVNVYTVWTHALVCSRGGEVHSVNNAWKKSLVINYTKHIKIFLWMHRLRLQTHLRATMQFHPTARGNDHRGLQQRAGHWAEPSGTCPPFGTPRLLVTLLLRSGALFCSPPPSQVSTASEKLSIGVADGVWTPEI